MVKGLGPAPAAFAHAGLAQRHRAFLELKIFRELPLIEHASAAIVNARIAILDGFFLAIDTGLSWCGRAENIFSSREFLLKNAVQFGSLLLG